MNSSASYVLSPFEQEKLIEKLEIFKIQGRDKRGCKVLRIIGSFLPARLVSVEALKKYLKEKVFPSLTDDADDQKQKSFSVVYVHTDFSRYKNFPGILALRSIYEAIPVNVKDNLQAIYFIHPSLQSRLFLATFGRLLFTGGLYSKVKYVSRLEFLWEHIKRKEMEIPEFVSDHDEELDSYNSRRPLFTDYADHPRGVVYGAAAMAAMDSPFSLRCIA